MEAYIDVSYFDAINGGSGQVRLTVIGVSGLADWLKANPGYLIREIRVYKEK